MRRPRATTSRHASSRLNTSAMAAAAYSPMLCPSSQAGSAPSRSSACACAYCSAKIAGWANSVRLTPSSFITSRIRAPRCGAIAASTSSNASRNTELLSYSSVAMPGYCVPWPLNSQPVDIPAAVPVSKSPRSAATASARSPTTIASRALPEALIRFVDQHSCAKGASLFSRSWASCKALQRRLSGESADKVRTPESDAPFTVDAGSVAGALASTMWQFVPPIPKLETPA